MFLVFLMDSSDPIHYSSVNYPYVISLKRLCSTIKMKHFLQKKLLFCSNVCVIKKKALTLHTILYYYVYARVCSAYIHT